VDDAAVGRIGVHAVRGDAGVLDGEGERLPLVVGPVEGYGEVIPDALEIEVQLVVGDGGDV
jgi:hypothetical protein